MSVERLTYRDANGEAWYSDAGTEADRLHFIADMEDLLGDDYDLDRLRELVEADREGRCVVLPVSTPTMAYMVNPQNGIISSGFYPTPGSVLHDTERGYAIAKTREAAEEALRKEQQDAAKV